MGDATTTCWAKSKEKRSEKRRIIVAFLEILGEKKKKN
jgi:hypothetical protein